MDTQSTPEKPVAPVQPPVAVKEKTKSRPAVIVLSILLLLALLGAGVLAQIVYGQNQALKSADEVIAKYSNENVQLKNAVAEGQNSGGRDFVVEGKVCGMALASVEAFMSTAGVTRQQTECNIGYLDNDYARVAVDDMVPDPSNGKQKPSGKGETFYFKRTKSLDGTDTWAMIGINPLSADEVQSIKNRYGVPDKVFTEDLPA